MYAKSERHKYKRLANARRPCDCSVLCLRPKSSLYSCSNCILDITSFGIANSVRRASNNGVGQFKPMFQVEGILSVLYFSVISYLIDCPTTLPLEVFTQSNFVADFVRLKLNFIPKNWKIVFEPPFGGLRGNVRTPSIARCKALVDFLFAIIDFLALSCGWDVISGNLSKSALFEGRG